MCFDPLLKMFVDLSPKTASYIELNSVWCIWRRFGQKRMKSEARKIIQVKTVTTLPALPYSTSELHVLKRRFPPIALITPSAAS